jgi:purine-binding chemotaxis protein CheW
MLTETIQSQSFLTFRLGEEVFAASVLHVIEILELSKITKVPRSPDFMRGVINLRGNVLPVIDTRRKFGLERIDDTVNTCIMVLNVEVQKEKVLIGALVDAVQEVLEIEAGEVQAAPSIGSRYKTEFIDGMVKRNDDFIMILNLNRIFSEDEVVLIKENTTSEL